MVQTHPKVIWPDLTYPSVACLVALGGAMATGVPSSSGSNRRGVLWKERDLARCLDATAAVGLPL